MNDDERIVFLTPERAEELESLERSCFFHSWGREEFRQLLSGKNFKAIALTKTEGLIGYLSFMHVPDEAEILNLGVLPEARRRGRARKLLNFFIDYCRKNGISRIFLEVRVSNKAAINLYQSLGFNLAGRRTDYYPETKEDALIYELKLIKEG